MTAVVVWLPYVLIAYILVAIQIYACYYFKSIQSSFIIQRRYPKLVLIEAYGVIIFLTISFPLWTNDLIKATTFGIPEETYLIISSIISSIGPLTHFIIVIEISRFWLVSYDLHHLHSSKNEQWKSQIDHSFAENDWYIKNKHKYGNTKYVMKRAFIYYLFTAVTIYILHLVHQFASSSLAASISSLMDGLFYFIDTFAIFYMYYKCRKYDELNDALLFHYEFRTITKAYIFGFLLYVLAQIFFILGMLFVGVCILFFASLWINTVPSLISSLLIPSKIVSTELWSDDLLTDYSSTNKDEQVMVEMQQGKTENDTGVSVETKLYETLKNEQEFEKFIEWMYREFSGESALAFVELVQFKEYLVDVIEKDKNEITSKVDYKYVNLLYDTVPKSSIVYAKNVKENALDLEEITSVKIMIQSLYDKYIKYDADLEVNIAAHLKRKYARFSGNHWNMEIDKLVNVFDAVLNEMFLFMRNSYVRYQKA